MRTPWSWREREKWGIQVPGNRARLAVGNDNVTTITFGRSTVTRKFVD